MQSANEAFLRIEVVPYNPNWPVVYQAEHRLLRACLSPLLIDIEHIGSTSVPGLSAKPIIDIMASCDDLGEILLNREKLESMGYVLVETGMRSRFLFRRVAEPDGQKFNLHIVGVDTWKMRKERIMKDYLVRHPQDAVAYGGLKQKLAISYAKDSLAYTKAKPRLYRRSWIEPTTNWDWLESMPGVRGEQPMVANAPTTYRRHR
jgi:GrpB-like predicted nucleotidyltransferase (UPF0157 family)